MRLSLFLVALVIYNTAGLYGVSFIDSLQIILERISVDQSIGSYSAIKDYYLDRPLPFGQSLFSEVCNIFSKSTLNLLFTCSTTSVHRMISGSQTSAVAVDIISDGLVNFYYPLGSILYGIIYGFCCSQIQSKINYRFLMGPASVHHALKYSFFCILGAYILIGIGSNPISIFLDFGISVLLFLMLVYVFSIIFQMLKLSNSNRC